MLGRLFRPTTSAAAGQSLYAGAVAQARTPSFYTALGVADRIDARFELYTLHVVLLVLRLGGEGQRAAETSQSLFDTFVSALDNTLREIGVGDLSVAKRIRPLAEAVYGRARGYSAALTGEPDVEALSGLLSRTVLAEAEPGPRAQPLVDYVIRAHASLSTQPLGSFLAGQAIWPEPAASAA